MSLANRPSSYLVGSQDNRTIAWITCERVVFAIEMVCPEMNVA
jgi:hypothetical protein